MLPSNDRRFLQLIAEGGSSRSKLPESMRYRNQEMKSIRVALVLYGQPRFVHLPYSFSSHQRILRGLEFQVLGHCWVAPRGEPMEGSTWSSIKPQTFRSNEVETILSRYPGAEILFEPPLKEQGMRRPALTWMPDSGSGLIDQESMNRNISNLISHMTSLQRALVILKQRHRMTPFDFVVLSRYDAVVLRFPKIANLDHSKLYLSKDHDRFPDFIVAGPVEKVLALDGLALLYESGATSDLLIAENLKRNSFFRFFGPSDIRYMDAISRPLRDGGRLVSILKLLAKTAYVRLMSKILRLRRQNQVQ